MHRAATSLLPALRNPRAPLSLRASAVQAQIVSGVRHQSAAAAAAAGGDKYDVVVVGAGPGGYVAAIKAAQLGLKTAVVESRDTGKLGGTCLNVGCIPSKAMLHGTHLLHQVQHDIGYHGIEINGDIEMNFDKLLGAKDKAIDGLTGGVQFLMKKNKVETLLGHGKIIGKNEISVAMSDGSNKSIQTENIIIATGSEVTPLPPVPVNNEGGQVVDSTGALNNIKKVPKTMAVVGGGVIGLEMGSVYSRLGTEVTVIEFLDRICPTMDEGLTKEFQKNLKKQGIKFKLSHKVSSSEVGGDGVTLNVEPSKGGDVKAEKYDVVLVATGRRPFTKGLGLEEMGVQMDKLGRVEVDDSFRTNIPNIYAIGDVIDGPMLAHKAEEEGIAAVEIIKGEHGHVNYDAIPGVVYTYPEVASVGKTEEELKEMGVKYNVGSFPFSANSRAKAIADFPGMVKMLSDAETDAVLGVHIIGPNAGEMIAEGVIGMEYGASSEDFGRTCHAHPTLSEAFKEAAMATYDKPIHF